MSLSGLLFIPFFFNNPNDGKRTTLHSFPQHDSLESTIDKSLVDLIIFCLKINITLANYCHFVSTRTSVSSMLFIPMPFHVFVVICLLSTSKFINIIFVILHNVFSPTNVLRNHTSYELFHLNLRLRNKGWGPFSLLNRIGQCVINLV